ncbi:MAG TPA: DUF4149 domain-containing protein [Longimicrobiaceae bacterium]|nr:DUF4149 domain-containing protein [Longimicrobiaceae bacterium]
MIELYYLNVTIHILAALLWIGGMFFLAAVGAPVLRTVQPPTLRVELFRLLGARFRRVGWIAITILLITGVLNLYFLGILRDGLLIDPAFWASRFGQTLAWKLTAVAAMLIVSGLHDFVFGPRSAALEPGSPESVAARRRAVVLARLNAALGVIVVIVAVRLARGG